MHTGHLADAFPVRTGVKQGCLLSPFLFLLAIDWIMKQSTSQKRNGIQCTSQSQLDDHTQQQMQEKSNIVTEHSVRPELNIHKILKVTNSTSTVSVALGVEAIEVDHFTYLDF